MSTNLIIARLLNRAEPLDRGDLFEDPLNDVLESANCGTVTGGGTQLAQNYEVEFCDLEIEVNEINEENIALIMATLEKCGAAKGSKLQYGEPLIEKEFGRLEGLAVYLNGSDLPDEIYEDCDINFVYEELNRLIEGIGEIQTFQEQSTETALYMYGSSFIEMKQKIDSFLATYPLCEKSRVLQIA